MLFVVLCPGTPECSTGSGSGFKASHKRGQRLKVSSDRLGEPGIEPATPGLQDLGLSPTPRRLWAGRFLFLFFISQKHDMIPLFLLFFISSKTNEAPFLFMLNIKMLIYCFRHMNKINEATFFIQV